MWRAQPIEPGLIVEARRLDHEGPAFPSTNRVAEPGGLRITRQRSPVRENLSPVVERFQKNDGEVGRLNDLEWLGWSEEIGRYPCGQTFRAGNISTQAPPSLAVNCLRPRR